eukprot:2152582-Prymnesium_polylepis.2
MCRDGVVLALRAVIGVQADARDKEEGRHRIRQAVGIHLLVENQLAVEFAVVPAVFGGGARSERM